ncbi:hypothetical protein B7C51_01995 [Paenibacillus larvae subsp. pulvifaciens]|uniref:Uncharacterized protein n=1 Tax=Paenibacillus larvae subsp. pulvifaciens TaxID=1477 RepID=A0A1V0UNK9_9BACL|nr:hypothetical protein B7C51_01995 [Paenibacillus larvae subsp. pulvifaciens]
MICRELLARLKLSDVDVTRPFTLSHLFSIPFHYIDEKGKLFVEKSYTKTPSGDPEQGLVFRFSY